MHRKKLLGVNTHHIVFLISIVITLFISITAAEAESMKFRIFTYVTRMESMPVGFIDAPTNVLIERMGFINFEDGDVARFVSRATGKNDVAQGSREGYALITYSDNSTSVFEWKIEFTTSEFSQLKNFTGSGKFIKGTGRYEGINGEVKLVGHEVIPLSGEPKGGAYFDVQASFHIPPH